MLFRTILKFKTHYQTKHCIQYSILEAMKEELNIVAVCQMTATNNKRKNLNTVKSLINSAKDKNANIVFLPEGCDFIANDIKESFELSEDVTGPLIKEYRELAVKHNIWISIGGFHERCLELESEKKIYNTHFIIDNYGKIKAQYRKLHLFNVDIPHKNIKLEESMTVNPGSYIVDPVDTPIGKVGLAICYDLRFPEMSTILRKFGATVLTFPSAFTHTTGVLHWETLLRARAIENQCYVLAAAQIGAHNDKRISHGRAMIVDPLGRIVAECPTYNGEESNSSVITAEIKDATLATARSEIPVFEHRRNDIYSLNCLSRKEDTAEDYNFSDKIIPADTVFYESAKSFAFTNIRCVVPGHVLIATKRVVLRLVDLGEDEIADLFKTVCKVQKIVENIYKCSSSTIVVQDGKDAGQTVKHVHVHILPRKEGDFIRNDDIYDILAKHDTEETVIVRRELKEMIEEATHLKQMFANH